MVLADLVKRLTEKVKLLILAYLLDWMHRTYKDWWPNEVFMAIQSAFAIPYIEVVLYRLESGGIRYCLAPRKKNDPHWPERPWNIPGSVWRRDDTLKDGVRKAADFELGVEAELITEVMTHKWFDHPYGRPVSHVCLCSHKGNVAPWSEAEFFPLKNLPAMVPHHAEFLEACERYLYAHWHLLK